MAYTEQFHYLKKSQHLTQKVWKFVEKSVHLIEKYPPPTQSQTTDAQPLIMTAQHRECPLPSPSCLMGHISKSKF